MKKKKKVTISQERKTTPSYARSYEKKMKNLFMTAGLGFMENY